MVEPPIANLVLGVVLPYALGKRLGSVIRPQLFVVVEMPVGHQPAALPFAVGVGPVVGFPVGLHRGANPHQPQEGVVSLRPLLVPGSTSIRNHTLSGWASHKPAHRDVYRSEQWTLVRKRVLRQQPQCAEPGCTERASEVDHIRNLGDAARPTPERT